MFIYDFTVAGILYNDSSWLFDSHNRNQHGQMVVNGQSVSLKFSQLSDLEKYIQTIYLSREIKDMYISKFNSLMSLLVTIQVRF